MNATQTISSEHRRPNRILKAYPSRQARRKDCLYRSGKIVTNSGRTRAGERERLVQEDVRKAGMEGLNRSCHLQAKGTKRETRERKKGENWLEMRGEHPLYKKLKVASK